MRVANRDAGFQYLQNHGNQGGDTMIVQFSGKTTIFSALGPGACFAGELEGKTHVGIKTREEVGGRAIDSCVLLAPGSGEAPRLLPERPRAEWPVLALAEAFVQPSVDPAQIQTEAPPQPEASLLLLVGERWFLVASAGGGAALVDVASGAVVRALRDPIRTGFRAWRIVQKGLGDEYDTICRHAVTGPSRIGFRRG